MDLIDGKIDLIVKFQEVRQSVIPKTDTRVNTVNIIT